MSKPAGLSAMWRKWLIRAGGSAVILAVLFWFLPREAILAGFSAVPLSLFVSVFGVFLLGHVAAAAKWWVLLDRGFPFLLALKAHFGGLAANLCLPGVAGGDAVRAAMAQAAMRDGPKVAAGAVADRLIDMLALGFLSLIGLLMLGGGGAGAGVVTQAVVLVLVLLLGTVFGIPWGVRMLYRLKPGLPGQGFALNMAGGFAALGRRPGLLFVTLGLSMAIQATFVMLTVQLSYAVGVDVPLGAWFVAWPLAKIFAVLPISLGGLGVREASMAALLAQFGGSAPEVVATGLVWQGVLWLTGALGALILLVSGLGARPVEKVASEFSE